MIIFGKRYQVHSFSSTGITTQYGFQPLQRSVSIPPSHYPVSYTHLDVYKRQGMWSSDDRYKQKRKASRVYTLQKRTYLDCVRNGLLQKRDSPCVINTSKQTNTFKLEKLWATLACAVYVSYNYSPSFCLFNHEIKTADCDKVPYQASFVRLLGLVVYR